MTENEVGQEGIVEKPSKQHQWLFWGTFVYVSVCVSKRLEEGEREREARRKGKGRREGERSYFKILKGTHRRNQLECEHV